MSAPLALTRNTLYSEELLVDAGMRPGSLLKARKSGQLKFTTKGGRVHYLGEWLLAWLTGEDENQPEPELVGAH